MLHVWSNIPTRLTSWLARLLTRCACFIIVRYTCYHMPIGLYNIMIEHGVGTQRFRSNLCSGFDLVSFPLWCTLVPGLELGTRLWFVDWITDEIVLLSHLTETPIDSVHSSVVFLRGVRLLACIGELNDLKSWSTDIGNAYLETYTKEKVYVIAGPEFGDPEGHVLIITQVGYAG